MANTQCSMLQLFMVASALFNGIPNIESKNDQDKFINRKFSLEFSVGSVAKNKFENGMQISFA